MPEATNITGTVSYAYDGVDNLIHVTYPGSRTFSYQYNETGQRTQVNYPDGNTLRYSYDSAGRLSKIKDENNPFEIVRIIRSFDPCLACAIHLITPQGKSLGQFRVC